MREMLDEKLERFEELEKQLIDQSVLSDPQRVAAVSREHGSLAKMANRYRRFKNLNEQILDAQEMIDGDDAEMRELAEAELPELKSQREVIWNNLLDMTVGGEDSNRTRCVMEVVIVVGCRLSEDQSRGGEQVRNLANTIGCKLDFDVFEV